MAARFLRSSAAMRSSGPTYYISKPPGTIRIPLNRCVASALHIVAPAGILRTSSSGASHMILSARNQTSRKLGELLRKSFHSFQSTQQRRSRAIRGIHEAAIGAIANVSHAVLCGRNRARPVSHRRSASRTPVFRKNSNIATPRFPGARLVIAPRAFMAKEAVVGFGKNCMRVRLFAAMSASSSVRR